MAKRLADYNFHAPTMSWPVAGNPNPNPHPNPNPTPTQVAPKEGVPEASRARGGGPPDAGGRAHGAGADAQGDAQGAAWWRCVLSDEPAFAASG